MSQNIDHNELAQKAQEYKAKLEVLQQEKTEHERKLIILEEQLNPYLEQIQKSFGTTDEEELLKIAESYLKYIEEVENSAS